MAALRLISDTKRRKVHQPKRTDLGLCLWGGDCLGQLPRSARGDLSWRSSGACSRSSASVSCSPRFERRSIQSSGIAEKSVG